MKTTSANITTASVLIAPSNPKRLAFIIWNNSSNSAYLAFGSTASSAAPQAIVASFTSYVWPYNNLSYTGPISAIRNAGTGNMTIAEFQEDV